MNRFTWVILLLLIHCVVIQGEIHHTENERSSSELTLRKLFSLFPQNSEEKNFPLPNYPDIAVLKAMNPLKEHNYIMFWRPQKVGSSTLLSILISYGYRYNLLPKRKAAANSFCRHIAQCALSQNKTMDSSSNTYLKSYISKKIPGPASPQVKISAAVETNEAVSLTVPFHFVLSHELCGIENHFIEPNLLCAFRMGQTSPVANQLKSVDQLFLVRNPLSRAISIYYFWGELSKMMLEARTPKLKSPFGRRKLQKKGKRPKLGMSTSNTSVERGIFRYHGVEATVPPLDYAVDFATKFPYRKGMPGPSFTWSGFAASPEEAISVIQSDKMYTLVLERLEESLIVLVHDLKWSIADVVVTLQRKALSSHPKYYMWAPESIEILQKKLEFHGEFKVYNASNDKLNEKIASLISQGVDFKKELQTLRDLKKKVTEVNHD
jgi:hypothetical protein